MKEIKGATIYVAPINVLELNVKALTSCSSKSPCNAVRKGVTINPVLQVKKLKPREYIQLLGSYTGI